MLGRTSLLTHPLVGDFELRSNKFEIPGTNALSMVVFHAEPGSRSAELLGLLGSLTASGATPWRGDSRAASDETVPERNPRAANSTIPRRNDSQAASDETPPEGNPSAASGEPSHHGDRRDTSSETPPE